MELLQPISEEQENECLAEIGYSRLQLQEDLVHIKEWLKEQHHLPPSRLTEKDEMLSMYLTGCKGKLDTVKSKLDAYYTFRSQSEIFSNRDPLDAKYTGIMDHLLYAILPRPTQTGKRIFLLKVSNDSFVHLEYMKKLFNIMDFYIRTDSFCIGSYIVFDLQDLRLNYLWKLNLRLCRDGFLILQNGLPVRVTGLFMVNVPYYIDFFMNNMIVPLVPKKIRNRICVTSKGTEVLSKFFSIDILPKEYGGQERSIKELTDAWLQKEISEREWFLNELSEHTDESKRIPR